MSGGGTVLTDAGRLSRLSGAMGCPGVKSNRSSLVAKCLQMYLSRMYFGRVTLPGQWARLPPLTGYLAGVVALGEVTWEGVGRWPDVLERRF